jgi:hypothetical protein
MILIMGCLPLPLIVSKVLSVRFVLWLQAGQAKSSCAELMSSGGRRSGLYHIKLPGARSSFWQLLVYCEQEISGGGWMVINKRIMLTCGS